MLRTRYAILCSLLFVSVLSQSQTTRTLKTFMELQMPQGEGTNGASVAWHPEQKKYYAAFAGNAMYPLAVFDANGKRLSNDELTTGFDVRGLWYDPTKKEIRGNAYADGGLFKLVLDAKGIPQSNDNFVKEIMQPHENAVGIMVPPLNAVCFLTGQELLIYKVEKGETEETIRLYAGKKNKEELKDSEGEFDLFTMPENYNPVSAIYTDKSKAEFGLLNFTEKQIELYDIKTGFLTQILTFPENTPVLPESFNFAYANGHFWIFDITNRKWIGYK